MLNDDYILRSDAISAIHAVPPGLWSRARYMDVVERVPAADVEPVRHGHWYFRGGRPCCSVCNTKALWKDEGGTGGFSHEYVGAKSKRCPECGAKMLPEPLKGEEDDRAD